MQLINLLLLLFSIFAVSQASMQSECCEIIKSSIRNATYSFSKIDESISNSTAIIDRIHALMDGLAATSATPALADRSHRTWFTTYSQDQEDADCYDQIIHEVQLSLVDCIRDHLQALTDDLSPAAFADKVAVTHESRPTRWTEAVDDRDDTGPSEWLKEALQLRLQEVQRLHPERVELPTSELAEIYHKLRDMQLRVVMTSSSLQGSLIKETEEALQIIRDALERSVDISSQQGDAETEREKPSINHKAKRAHRSLRRKRGNGQVGDSVKDQAVFH